MINRKQQLKAAFERKDVQSSETAQPGRVSAGAVRAMGLNLSRLGEDAARVASLESQLASGQIVQDIDPADVTHSFVEDRLARTADKEFRRLVDSIAATGQQVPILVRPQADQPGRYQVAYGHRRLSACLELGIPVKALVRRLTDVELVVAQGKENAERRNLSFIERAMFARHLEERGFERATLQASLSVHPAEMSRLLTVARSIPTPLVAAIGSAPRAGRPRWLELAALLSRPGSGVALKAAMESAAFKAAGTDGRFDIVLGRLRGDAGPSERTSSVLNSAGAPVIRVEKAENSLRLIVDLKLAPGFDETLLAALPGMLAAFEGK
jgi:ParB family chromosome partitioning protein